MTPLPFSFSALVALSISQVFPAPTGPTTACSKPFYSPPTASSRHMAVSSRSTATFAGAAGAKNKMPLPSLMMKGREKPALPPRIFFTTVSLTGPYMT